LVSDPAAMLHFAEVGVVLLLVLVGVELGPRRLWAMRRPIFGGGTVQLLGSAVLMVAVVLTAGLLGHWSGQLAGQLPWQTVLVAALGLAMSSTAIGLGALAERNLMATRSGQSVLSVALLQDIAAIPILALVPLLAVGAATAGGDGGGWLAAAKALGVIVAIVLGGRLLLRPALRWIARSDTPEIFTAAALLLVVATAALMQSVGLSMALGAFLAGVLLAESGYRRGLETGLEPFKGLLLGLFFIAVGMSIDFAVVLAHPVLMAAVVTGFLALKALVLWGLAHKIDLPLVERPVYLVLLAQGGEFGFVVFQTAQQSGVVDAPTASFLVAAVAMSMLLTPLLLLGADRWWVPKLAKRAARTGRGGAAKPAEISEPQNAPVIIAGFGRYGQIVGRLLNANGLSATVLEQDADQVETVRRFGWPVFYGDATRLDLLRTAGAASARVLVLAIDDVEQSLKVAALARAHFPQLCVVARARNVTHYYRLRQLGVSRIERETLDASLMSGRQVLELMGWQPHTARNQALRFRAHNIELLEQMAPHLGDEQKLIALAKQGRQQLETMRAQERAEQAGRRNRQGWQAGDESGPPP
ncbi:MAG: glutathione-regulated potassium-efflux system protein KefC, partial [Microbacteriaceae bacterium]|nr:glutathione-regulated potassium-efflux system protein KefC [Burkholderiaceae bacterium]